jgi:gentisate 1,2-dioxygenase
MNQSATVSERQEFYGQIDQHHLAPLWERAPGTRVREPVTPAVPYHWNYDDIVRPFMHRAGGLITAREAERRVLILENPGLRGQRRITGSLFAGLQLILPGEVAPAHRHTPAAIRFIIEGHGAYTAVEGERAVMEPGDFILTPSWSWHDHGNETGGPMVWLDGLDTPLVRMLDANFADPMNDETQNVTRPTGDSLARFGANMVPVDWKPETLSSPVFSYPNARSRETLTALSRNGGPDPYHGYKLRYINPATGGSPMPTIAAFMALLPGGFDTAPYRSTDGTIYSVVEGTGETIVGETVLRWKPRDIFVVPSWHTHHHRAASEAALFSFSDRPVHDLLGLWREERLRA